MAAKGKIITFYSYKGGTGRTMALANVACLLAEKQQEIAHNSIMGRAKDVLVIDWDLDAPGLHRYLDSSLNNCFDQSPDPEAALIDRPGLIDFFYEIKTQFKTLFPHKSQLTGGEIRRVLRQIPLEQFILKTDIPNLCFLKAGSLDGSYSRRVRNFDWEELFRQAEDFFTIWAEQLAQQYSYVLIDSRTGITDISNICTTLMSEKLVVLFTPNRQSIQGSRDIMQKAVSYRRSGSNDLRPLIVFPLPSRVELSEQRSQEMWRFGDRDKKIPGYQPIFKQLFKDIYPEEMATIPEMVLDQYFDLYFSDVQVQHVPFYAYGEEIAVLVEGQSSSRLSLSQSYRIFTEILIKDLPWKAPLPPLPPSPLSLDLISKNLGNWWKMRLSPEWKDLLFGRSI